MSGAGAFTRPERVSSEARSDAGFCGIGWWAVLGSNQRPLPCEGSALPLS
jgi:hypothetical protein